MTYDRTSQVGAYVEVEGQAVVTSEAAAYLEIEGQAVTTSQSGAYIEVDEGIAKTSQHAYLHGSANASASAHAYLEGIGAVYVYQTGAYVEVSGIVLRVWQSGAYVEIQEPYPALSSQSAYLSGIAQATSSQHAYLTGPNTAEDTQSAYLSGQDTNSDSQSAYTHGQATSSDSQAAYLASSSTALSQQSAFAQGKSLGNSSLPAYLAGGVTASDSQSAYLYGIFSSSDSQSAFLDGCGQVLNPDGDISQSDNWQREDTSTSNLYISIDEYPYDDADYVWYDNTSVGKYFEVSLENPTYPTVGSGDVKIHWRARRRSGIDTITIKMELRQGAAVIASQSKVLSDTDTTYSYTLTSGEVSSITDWTDLRLRFTVESMT